MLSGTLIMAARTADGAADRGSKLNRAGDVALLALASCVAAFQGGVFDWQTAASLTLASAALWLVAARALHQYDPGNGRGFFDDVALTLVMIGSVVGPMIGLCLFAPRVLPLEQVVTFSLVLPPTVLLLRIRGVGLRLWRSTSAAPVLVAGTGPLGRLTGAEIGQADTPRPVLGYLSFDDEAAHDRLSAPVFGRVEGLESALRLRVVGEVYFASTTAAHAEEMQAGIRTCEKLGVPFALPVCAYRLTRTHMLGPASDGYVHFLAVPVKPFQRAFKRAFDILASGAALLALAPLLIVTALVVKATSRGPVLFKQERCGLHGRTFNMLKFRSMVDNAEDLKSLLSAHNEQSGPVFKMTRDPRVTAVGRFIRKYSIDELPQLVNVLRGDMSVVGPRPPIPSEVQKYEGWQYRRLSVRPGLTCVWQVSGRNEISFQDWMLLDMRYIDHWSLFGDFSLIWRTIPVVLLGRGAS